MIRTSRRLADGREILYFDDGRRRRPTTPPTPATCRRSPPTRSCAGTRCSASGSSSPPTGRAAPSCPPADQCPLCPSRPGRPTEIPDADYQVVAFENRFPSLATGVDRDVPPSAPGRRSPSCAPGSAAARWSSSPATTTATSPSWAPTAPGWSSTCGPSGPRSWPRIDGVEQVFVFENHGEEIGVTLSHPHGQIYAYPFVAAAGGEDARLGPPAPRGHRRRPVRRRAGRRAVRAAGGRAPTSTGRRSCRPRRAGPTRCSCSRTGRCPTCRRSPTTSATPSSPSTSTCWAASRTASTPRCPTSPPGTRRRCAPAARSGGCTCSCSPCAGRRASSSTWPARSPAWARSSPTPTRRTSPSSCGPWSSP